MIKRSFAVFLSVLVLAPAGALAQQSKAGIVTTLEGNVSARRVALPTPVSLKFKDDVFLQDTVTTGDKSLARMLLGGKAVVTVRERGSVIFRGTGGAISNGSITYSSGSAAAIVVDGQNSKVILPGGGA